MNNLSVTDADRAAYAGRSCEIDYSVTKRLHYLGNYTRDIPTNLRRMMENARDWEHLPFVHPSSFAAIELVEEGRWGCRFKTSLPNNGGEQLIEMLIDTAQHYWATCVVEGLGKGTQIHTQASALAGGGISVDARFYLPQPLENAAQDAVVLGYLQAQYKTLYDEDEQMMLGRQMALDERKMMADISQTSAVIIGLEAQLDRSRLHRAVLGSDTVCVRYLNGAWAAYAARCPHVLGPLDKAEPDADGQITCPWHGYRFDLATGAEERGRCQALPIFRCTVAEDGYLQVIPC